MDVDWEQRYKLMKKNYDAMVKFRITSIVEDIQDLERKIQEHKNVYEQTGNALEEYQEILSAENREKVSMDKKIPKLEKNISRLVKELSSKDRVLLILLGFPELKITMKEKNVYYVQVDRENGPAIALKKTDTAIFYAPISGIDDTAPSILQKKSKIKYEQLESICSSLVSIPIASSF